MAIVRRLNAISGVTLPEKIATSSWAFVYPDVLAEPGVLSAVLDVAAWVLEVLRTSARDDPSGTG
jgi:hypothetical protein